MINKGITPKEKEKGKTMGGGADIPELQVVRGDAESFPLCLSLQLHLELLETSLIK